ncbi:MAG: hypothetical protein IPG94_13555 [Kineosporiaceae bacterium]|nr:hypothetical protein [Kineosporiaceae bacterium]
MNAGVNLVNLGANEGYTRARVTYKGDIRLFVYRSIAKDPVKDPTRATTTFRQSHQYESRLMGSMYACLRTTATGVKKMSSWVFAKSGGRTLNRIVDLRTTRTFHKPGHRTLTSASSPGHPSSALAERMCRRHGP